MVSDGFIAKLLLRFKELLVDLVDGSLLLLGGVLLLLVFVVVLLLPVLAGVGHLCLTVQLGQQVCHISAGLGITVAFLVRRIKVLLNLAIKEKVKW